MTHDELLAICDNYSFKDSAEPEPFVVVDHKPNADLKLTVWECGIRKSSYPAQLLRLLKRS
jgi:hypothetical protein